MKTILNKIAKFLETSTNWFYQSEKHLTDIFRHVSITVALLTYFYCIYFSKTIKPSFEYNLGFIIWLIIFWFAAKYIAKLMMLWRKFTKSIDKKKDTE